MSNTDITKLSRTQLIKHLEQERKAWFSLGMSEADIFRIHFGEPDKNGRGGDYRIWLDERRHTRADHKYALGTPISTGDMSFIEDIPAKNESVFDSVDFSIDLEQALTPLTDLQRKYVILVLIHECSYAEAARKNNITEGAVRKHIRLALPKLKNYYIDGTDYPFKQAT
jgi:RNA polymerase sigma factor (sigma-70 family)